MTGGAAFYKLSMYVDLVIAGSAVNLPCGVFMWRYHSVADAAGQAVGYDIALQDVLYRDVFRQSGGFLWPGLVVSGEM